MNKMDIKDGTPETGSHWFQSLLDVDKPTICIDFHHTITKTCETCSKDGYVLQDGAVEAIQKLSKDFNIIIYTGNPDKLGCLLGDIIEYKNKIIKFLEKYNIPFKMINFSKPPAMFIIDDRAIHHKGWDKTLLEIERRTNR